MATWIGNVHVFELKSHETGPDERILLGTSIDHMVEAPDEKAAKSKLQTLFVTDQRLVNDSSGAVRQHMKQVRIQLEYKLKPK